MAVFRYTTLTSSRNIRLLVLKPSFRREAPLECDLKKFSLKSPPRYEAVSYTWEGQRPSQPIRCNDSELMVTPNVETALRQLRRRFFQRRLWIDAVCIDQGSLDERAQQVRLMGQIYQKAVQVVVWLGLADDTTVQAIRTLKWVFPLCKLAFPVPFLSIFAQRYSDKMKARLRYTILHGDHRRKFQFREAHEGSPEQAFSGLRQILHHDWFSRIWTLQEISLASKATVYCGRSKITWTTLSNALTYNGIIMAMPIGSPVLMEGGYNPETPIYYGTPFISRMQQIRSLQKWNRLSKQHQPPLPVILNLILTGLNPEYLATDPKDKIFGLVGLLQAFGVFLPAPDYRKAFPEILLEVFSEIAMKYQNLEFLLFVIGERSVSDLPSWIPEFCNVPWYPDARYVRRWCERGLWGMGTNSTIEGRKLHLSGILVDYVVATTDPISGKEYQGEICIHDSIEVSSKDFITHLHEWISFVRATVCFRSRSQDNEALLLFSLLLHGQILPFYTEKVGDSGPDRRLFQHFQQWLEEVVSQGTRLTSADDYRLDQGQEFISWELFYNYPDDYFHTIGYDNALLAIQRWVREYTARKRLFTTSLGHVGIGWQPLREGDQIACIPGLRSPLLIRKMSDASDKSYRLIGPCNVPQPQLGREPWKKNKNFERFVLV